MNQDFLYCLAVSPNFQQDGLVFAAKQSGLFRSSDSGRSWQNAYASLGLDSNLPTSYVSLAQTAEKTLIVYACVNGNILWSFDGGNTWETVKISSPAPVVTSMVVSPDFAQDGILLIGTMQDGIFRSTNRGLAWTGWNFGLFDPFVNSVAISSNFAKDQTLLAGTQSGVFRSINGGRSWRDLDFPITLAPVLSLAQDRDGTIYAGTEEHGLYISRDLENTWEPLSPDLNSGSIDQIFWDEKSGLIAIQDGMLQLSKDGGQTWESRPGFEASESISCIVVNPGGSADSIIWVGQVNGDVIRV